MAYLEENSVVLPTGGTFSVKRFQSIGIGGINRIHQLVFRIANDLEIIGKMTYKTLQLVEEQMGFDGNPFFAILHEPIYCQGHPPRWAAARAVAQDSQFTWEHIKSLSDTEPVYFYGEMVYPECFDDFTNLRPLKGAVEILAKDDSWSPLYDVDQLKKNEVKVSAATYVEFGLAQEIASTIKNCEQYITNQLLHDGLYVDGKDVMKRLFQLSTRVYD
ncbi:hypothetical protein B0H19DRAFT_1246154 [Mycena capillaripes]|nr:hypothetical protein B0H19DRAFT_1246154 [Mycena capillaripes]